jgi:NADH dehydrogenase [ubiquinone] 1 alpha subcomplex assembly factor 6
MTRPPSPEVPAPAAAPPPHGPAVMVRRYDPDRFLATLAAPETVRPALWALLAFNYEIARVREMVSQPVLGQIRLQWWREALDEMAGGGPVRRHEVATPLAAALRRFPVSRAHLDALIDARERDLGAEPPADLVALEAFLEATSSRLIAAEAEILSGADGGEAARLLGIAWGLVGVIRAVPFQQAAGICHIPAALGWTPQQGRSPALGAALASLGRVAAERLAAARALRRSVPIPALPALLIGRLAAFRLKQLEAADWDPYRIPASDPLAPGRIAWGRLIRRY